MVRMVWEDERVAVPDWVSDLESFRRWTDDDAFPEVGRYAFLLGEVWIDRSKQQLFTHNRVKTEIARVLANLVKAGWRGLYFGDGAFVSNADADVSNQPDGVFVSEASLAQGRVKIIEGRKAGHVELEGSPDMVLEVVSDSSVEKDTVVLRNAYARAGIAEYWLVDARGEALSFDLLRLKGNAYAVSRKRKGWTRSDVFARWCQLLCSAGLAGYSEYTLEMRQPQP